MENKKLFKKSDLLIVAACLMIAGLSLLPKLFTSNENLTAVITADNSIYKEIPLNAPDGQTIEVNNTKIIVKNGEIYFAESDCKDKICVKTGHLTEAGDASACVPNRVSVYIKGGDSEFDAVAY